MGQPNGNTPSLSWGEENVIISLAGRIAEHRALRPNAQGWRPLLSREQLTCFHESGHAAVAHALGWHSYEVTIDVDPTLKAENGGTILGYASIGVKPQQAANAKITGTINTDCRKAATFCLLMGGNWKGALRHVHAFRAAARDLVERNWAGITFLAWELEFRRRIGQERIASVLERAKSNEIAAT